MQDDTRRIKDVYKEDWSEGLESSLHCVAAKLGSKLGEWRNFKSVKLYHIFNPGGRLVA